MEDTIARFGLLEDEAILLDASALELASLDHLGVALDSYVDLLGDITRRLVVLGSGAEASSERAYALAEVIGGEFGFAGDQETYDDPDNADLIRVIDRRRGLPVSLSILYVAAARRLNWEANALNTPGHVLVRIGSPTEPVLLDPFNSGAVVLPPQLAALLANVLGPHTSPTSEHLASLSNRSVLIRLLINQATRAEASGSVERALTLYKRMTLISPSNAHAWWERARLELIAGSFGEARSSLSSMLEVTREPGLRAHVFTALDALSGSRT
jgi:regulator of sirC expression with transglutaminase-like and TPR domain